MGLILSRLADPDLGVRPFGCYNVKSIRIPRCLRRVCSLDMKMIYSAHMCKKIVEYLHSKVEKQDSLEGIILGLFPEEINMISEKILKNITYLISKEIICELKDKQGKSYYKIV